MILWFFIGIIVGINIQKVDAMESKIYHTERFCDLKPYYNFDCMTITIWFDNTVPCRSPNAFACASWPQNTIVLSIAHPETLSHEIRHLSCQCNFHPGELHWFTKRPASIAVYWYHAPHFVREQIQNTAKTVDPNQKYEYSLQIEENITR